jgi:hypothetical protein
MNSFSNYKNNFNKISLFCAIFLSICLWNNNIFALENEKQDVIIDSEMTFAESVAGSTAPQNILQNLCLIEVEYYSFDKKLHRGQLVIHKEVKENVIEIFELIKKLKFPVQKVVPIAKYNWSDSLSMAENNTSAFNYRVVSGTKTLSDHAFGKAIDINPVQNPYKSKSGIFSPKNSTYNVNAKGTLAAKDEIVKLFLKKGWEWGGNYKSIKDWQHFSIK